MDEYNAKKLVKKTFGKKFNELKFSQFLVELFNDKDIVSTESTGNLQKENLINYVSKGFSDYINSIYSIGSYQDDFRNSIEFYIVNVKRHSSIDRARTMQRNLIAKQLTNRNKTAALVAFFEDSNDDWRFSFVKLEYGLGKGLKIEKKLTPAKRHSYLVGPAEPNHTAKIQFKDLLIFEGNVKIEQIENCFNIENVTDEFFDEYEKLFEELNNNLNSLRESDDKIENELTSKDIKTEDFTKKLLGQFVFLYFLQKKGWLGVKKDESFGSGPHDFVNRLFNKEFVEYDNFFNDILEPLFYKGFSEDVADYHNDEFNCKIPFLNGGLFEPINQYDWKNTDITLKNEIFVNIFKTFNLFNFTVLEDQPLDKEVAVDPEMLGKVLEKLSNDRRNEGKYYTPREIVHYMCQQSLITYLANNSEISKEDLRKLIENGDLIVESLITRQEEAKKYAGKSYTKIDLPDSILNNSKELEKLLKNVKVVDPAVGSGAFPVGMMNEIVKAISILQLINNDFIDYYELKKETIENSLYGVDKDFSATDITKLRFWLSLIVDEESFDDIQPLPNLDNQILCGNSLIDNFESVKLFEIWENNYDQQSLDVFRTSQQKFKRLEKKKRQFFNTDSVTTKKRLRDEIENFKWEIVEDYLKETKNSDIARKIGDYKNSPEKPFLLWDLEFSEVFEGKNPGFDVVIGNPPYIDESTNRKAFDGLRTSPCYQGKMNLWYLFGCKALDIVKYNGIVSFIAPNNWITNDGASKFRNKVNDEGHIDSFIDFGDYKVFEAGIQTMIYLMRKNNEDFKFKLSYSKLYNKTINVNELNEFLYSDENSDNYNKFLSNFNRKLFKDDYFTFLESSIANVIEKIKSVNAFYLDKNEIFSGADINQDFLNKKNAIKLGKEKEIGKGIFVLTDYEKYQLNLKDKEFSLLKPYYTTKQLFRYHAHQNNDLWLIYTKSDINNKISNYPTIKKHLDQFKEIITSDNKPYGLHRARDENIFLGKKIMATRKCQKPTFTLVNFDSYISRTFNIIKTNKLSLKVLVAILNSKLVQFWLRYMGKMQGSNYQLDMGPLRKIPIIKDFPNKIEEDIIRNINLILEIGDLNESKKYEDNINKIIFNLYGLDNHDIQIIENNI